MAQITAKDISFFRGERPIFSHIDFSIDSWELILIKGPSGSGKTTLLRVLWWLLSEQSSTLIRSYSERERIKTCGFHFVDGPFLEYLTVEENLLLLEMFSGIVLSREYLLELAKKFGLEALLSRKVSSLSSWQRERVSFIRSFLHKPEIIFLDEPGSNLDELMGNKIKKFLLEELEKGKSLVLSSHADYWDKYAKTIIELPLYES